MSAGQGAADITESMREYYAQRALYYERVYHRPERQADLRAIEAWLATQFAHLDGLEIACGTGWWTPHAARDARSWLATDLNPQTMEVALRKALPAAVRFATVDAYTLQGLGAYQPDGASVLATSKAPKAPKAPKESTRAARFDAAFAGCWWSHVPLQRLPGWLALLHDHLASGARVVFLDNSFVQTSSTPLSRRDDSGNTYQNRVLDDGSQHEVLKNFPTPDQAILALGPRATDVQWLPYTHYWVLSYALP